MSEERPSVVIYKWCLTGTKRAPTTGAQGEPSNEREDGYFKGTLPTHEEINGLFWNHAEWLEYLDTERASILESIQDIEDKIDNVNSDFTYISEADYQAALPVDPSLELEYKLRRRESDLKEIVDEKINNDVQALTTQVSMPGGITGAEIILDNGGTFDCSPGSIVLHEFGALNWAGVKKTVNIGNKSGLMLNDDSDGWRNSEFVQVGSTPLTDGVIVHIFYCDWQDNLYVDTSRGGVNINAAYEAANPDADPLKLRRLCTSIIKQKSKDGSVAGYYVVGFNQRGDDFIIKRRAPFLTAAPQVGYDDDNVTDFYLHSGLIQYENVVDISLAQMYCPIITNGEYEIELSFAQDETGTDDSSIIAYDTASQYRIITNEGHKFGYAHTRKFTAMSNKISIKNVSLGANDDINVLRAAVISWKDMRGKDGKLQ